MENEKKYYPTVEELLPEGDHLLKVTPQNIWDKKEGKYMENTIMSGEYKTGGGHWYIFKTKIGEEWVSMFANDENKAGFDSGYIKANIVPKRVKGSEDDIYDKDGKKLLRAFYNVLSPAELEIAKTNLIKNQENKEEEVPQNDDEDPGVEIDEVKY